MAINVITTKTKPWKSLGSDKDIEAEALPKDKPSLAKMHFTARRDIFIRRKALHNFLNRDAMDDGAMYLRPQKDAFKDPWLYRQEIDIGVQAVHPLTDLAAQTPYYRQVNVAVQAEPYMTDARIVPGKEAPNMEPAMKKFFAKVLPRLTHHLIQNNEVNIFGDDYLRLTEDDALVGSREENYLKEGGAFSHHYTREKLIMSIDWRPGKSAVAVAVMPPQGAVERMEAARSVDSSVCIVWSFNEQANPQFILEAPADVLTLKFCPTKPNIIVGGLINGLVVVWDLNVDTDAKGRHSKHGAKVRQPQPGGEDVTAIPKFDAPVPGQTPEKSGDHMVWRLKPKQISRVEHSHRRAVHDICWLPADVECGFDNKFVEAREGQNQFATIGEDGYMFIWDLRPANQPEQKMKRLKNTKIPGDQPMWVPLLKYQLTKPDGSGDLYGMRLHLECKDADGNPTYLMCCSSVEGEFATCYWGPKDDRPQNQGGFDDGQRREQKIVRSLSSAHAGPGYSVQRHPMLPDYYLTVGDWGFKIWKLGLPSPILASPLSDQQILCGRWSPTRPAVVFVTTGDGFVQIWDLLDRSHEKLFGIQINKDSLTTLEFKPSSERKGNAAVAQQHLVVGNSKGEFRLYELPRKLVKAHPSELRLTKQFFERESRRVAYFQWRWKERQREMDLMLQERGESKAKGDDGEGGDEDAEYNITAEEEDEFKRLVDSLGQQATA